MRTVRKVIETGVLGELLEIESHYDYYRPSIADRKGLGMLYGLQVHPIDQIVGEFGVPDKSYVTVEVMIIQGIQMTIQISIYSMER